MMKNGILFFVPVILITVFAPCAWAQSDYQVALNQASDSLTITKYTGKEKYISIPATIQGFPVKEIGDKAFVYKPFTQTEWIDLEHDIITAVTIPEGVTSIGSEAFRNCTNLTTVRLPSTLTSIGVNAFLGCTALTNVTIPESVTNINGISSAFSDSKLNLASQARLRGITDQKEQQQIAEAEKQRQAEQEKQKAAEAERERKRVAEQARLRQLKQGTRNNALNNTTWQHISNNLVFGVVNYVFYFGNDGNYRFTSSGGIAASLLVGDQTGTFFYTGNTVVFTPSDGSDLYAGNITGNSLALSEGKFWDILGDTTFTRKQ